MFQEKKKILNSKSCEPGVHEQGTPLGVRSSASCTLSYYGIIPPLFVRKIVELSLTLFSCDSVPISSPVCGKKMQQSLLFMMTLNSRN